MEKIDRTAPDPGREHLAELARILEDCVGWTKVPPRVEYRLTAFGSRFVELLDELESVRRAYAATVKG